MTGYGAAEAITEKYTLKVELKSLNSKFLDLILKLPREFSDREMDIKSIISRKLIRGKVSFMIDFQPNQFEESPIEINQELFQLYFDQFAKLAENTLTNRDEIFMLAVNAPKVMVSKEDFSDLISYDEMVSVVREALEQCDQFRIDEGRQLEKALRKNIAEISQGLAVVSELDPTRVVNIRSRLDQAISELREKTQVDENRFEQELIFYVEKLDISEEKVRLKSHLDYFLEILDGPESNGKKLGFIAQEIGREINTIGSKANDADIQKTVVKMKDELEQIKEQVLNVM